MGREFVNYKGGLKPSFRFLSDKAVIIQAWKKAHEYMRRHNWYSDNFELDCSCINLEELLLDIQSCFKNPNDVRYMPIPVRVVPAPKACSGWKLDEDDFVVPDGFSIRPLAHLAVRDQVVAMMFLMCLANTIEKRQGPPRWYNAANVRDIAVNYGNRLLCEAPNDESDTQSTSDEMRYGTFLWGNSETYDRYYNDYRMFISRPEEVHKGLSKAGIDRRFELFTLSLDLSKFYDRIKRNVLFEKVRKEVNNDNQEVRDFLLAFKRLLMWKWDETDRNLLKNYQDNQLGFNNDEWLQGQIGIPQGLAASGFFANIYLLDFDDYMRNIVSHEQPLIVGDSRVRVFDYCRYVDDMKLVIGIRKSDVPTKLDVSQIRQALQRVLDITASGQIFSTEKGSLDRLGPDEHTDFVALRMCESKSRVSDALDEQSAYELLKINHDLWRETERLGDGGKGKVNKIGSISLIRNKTGVKNDTIERFAANNWRNAYKVLSSVLPSDEGLASIDEIKRECSLPVLNALTDEFCEEIILRWIDDPSKVRILRIAFDLRPNAQYLDEVLKMLLRMIERGNCVRECGLYVASELYRAGAIETGFSYSDVDNPYHGKWIEYRGKLHEYVSRFAMQDAPWYLANQLALFEFTYSTKSFPVNCTLPLNCDPIYQECYSIISGGRDMNNNAVSLEAVILASLISVSKSVCESCKDVIEMARRNSEIEWRKCLAFLDAEEMANVLGDSWQVAEAREDVKLASNTKYVLRSLAFMDENPFENEVAVARLGEALCRFVCRRRVDVNHFFTTSNIAVACSDWKELSNARNSSVRIEVSLLDKTEGNDLSCHLFQPEPWEDDDFAKLAQVGRILRALVMSGDEYSIMKRGSLSLKAQDDSGGVNRFFGARSSWLKRRYGLYFDRSCLGGVHVAFSPWFTDVLSSLLAWPGSYCCKKYEHLCFSELGQVFKSRLKDLSRFQFVYPDTVLIPVDVDVEKFKKCEMAQLRKVNIAIIQNLHPDLRTLEDVADRESIEAKRLSRRHLFDLISMLRVTFKTHSALMKARDSINLLVFPELSIYERDVPYLKRFADKMNCMIFAGLVYCRGPKDCNSMINAGMWIIPQRKDGDDRRKYIELLQGKGNLSHVECCAPWLSGYRPVQWIVRGVCCGKGRKRAVALWSMSASICYDATDIKLAAALRDHVDCYVVSAFNKDVGLFDIMAESWRYHMYGHTVVANTGIYGGSTIQAPYDKPYERIIAHAHGGGQAQILLAELDLHDFSKRTNSAVRKKKPKTGSACVRALKASPAGYQGRVR